MRKKLFRNFSKKFLSALIVITFILVGAAVAVSFFEPDKMTSSFTEPLHTRDKGDWFAYGRGWIPNASGAGSGELSSSTCALASSTGGVAWFWFEDGNGDGDTTDEEDGLCVKATSTLTGSWNGTTNCTTYDNSYLPTYECAGNFPNGYVSTTGYTDHGGASCAARTSYAPGQCALCDADCYDGKRDLPARGTYVPSADNHGPLTTEILKNWKGTRLPSSEDYYGFCGSGGSGCTGNYCTACTANTTDGTDGHQNGRSDECMSLSDYGTYEWLSERHTHSNARIAGNYACSYFNSYFVYGARRFRALFRP